MQQFFMCVSVLQLVVKEGMGKSMYLCDRRKERREGGGGGLREGSGVCGVREGRAHQLYANNPIQPDN